MVKSAFNLTPWFTPSLDGIPPPPPLPKYDPQEEAPKWDWYRIFNIYPRYERDPEIPRVGSSPNSNDKPDWRGVVRNNIQPLDRVEEYKYGQAQRRHYFWFDTPDYADPFKKLWYSFKFFTQFGLLGSCVVALMKGYSFNYQNNRLLFTRNFFPFVAGGMLFSTTTILVANIRGNKDDLYNYLAAGLFASLYTGRKNHINLVQHTFFWVPAGLTAKYNAETNGVLLLRTPPGLQNWGLSGMHAQGGIETGNFQLFKPSQGDPGRGVRRFAL